MALAKEKGVDAIHPGYGFLSENPEFAQACKDAGIIFIGPEPKVLDMMGDKTAARNVARKLGVPILEGTDEPVSDRKEALSDREEDRIPAHHQGGLRRRRSRHAHRAGGEGPGEAAR